MRELMQAGHRMRAEMGRRLKLSDTELQAMDELVSSDSPLGPVELGHRLGIRSASATTLVDRLEAAGHLHRDKHPSDRRRITLTTTTSARTDVLTALRPLLDSIAVIAERLDPQSTELVTGVLGEIAAAMNQYAAGIDPERPNSW